MAGREKDFVFIKDLLEQRVIHFDLFIERVAIILEMPQRNALHSRLEKLEQALKTARLEINLRLIQELMRKLEL